MTEKFDYTQYQLQNWDFAVLVIYFVSLLAVGIWVSIFQIGEPEPPCFHDIDLFVIKPSFKMTDNFDFKQYQLEFWDFVGIVIYFVSLLSIGIWVIKLNSV